MKPEKNVKQYLLYLLVAICMVASVIARYPKDDENFTNSDATYHTLLTIQAYDETPILEHKFLPIASLGQVFDKDISWGATVEGDLGNYYYTSFGPIGFVAPYLFFKLFQLPVAVSSLYLFNSLLYMLSFGLLYFLFRTIFSARISKEYLLVLLACFYLCTTELLHSMGVSYWVHSIYQVLLLLQLLLFLRKKESNHRWVSFFFYALCFAVPYAEWTGYISNVAFAILIFFEGATVTKKKIKIEKSSFCKAAFIGALTIGSALFYLFHFSLSAPISSVIYALQTRSEGRSFSSALSFTSLWGGYVTSYGAFLYLAIIAVALALVFQASRKKMCELLGQSKEVLFVFAFVLIENMVMLGHALTYTYDRSKGAFLIAYFLVVAVISLGAICTKTSKKVLYSAFLCGMGCIAAVQVNQYVFSESEYRWSVDYIETNQAIAQEIQENYNENTYILYQEYPVRGYANLLFGKGIYEGEDREKVEEVAALRQATYLIVLQDVAQMWNLYEYTGYTVLERIDDTWQEIETVTYG